MKPRIRKVYGIWQCLTWEPRCVGCGYTFTAAYDEWKRALGVLPWLRSGG